MDPYRKIKAKHISLRVIPGKKLFANCNIKVVGMLEGNDSSCHTSSADSEIEDAQVQIQADQSLQEVNTSLEYLGESPLKFNGVPSSRKRNYAKRKVDQASHSIRAKISKALNVNEADTEQKIMVCNSRVTNAGFYINMFYA